MLLRQLNLSYLNLFSVKYTIVTSSVIFILGINLEEWRVSSSQIPSILPTNRRNSSRRLSVASSNTNTSLKRVRETSLSSKKVPKWTLNIRNSTICRHDNKQVLGIGDCVILHGVDKSLSYIGKVLKFYRHKSTQQDLVRLKWYYSPQETPMGVHKNDLPVRLQIYIDSKIFN